MKKYALFFKGGNPRPDQMQKMFQDWGKWMGALTQQGIIQSGSHLTDTGKIVSGEKKTVTDFSRSAESLNSFLVIASDDLEGAIKAASGCPLLAVGGKVEIREINEH
jgi:hypothetical protein